MGTWGPGTTQNDEAAKILQKFEADQNVASLTRIFDAIVKTGSSYLEAPESQAAISAADIIASNYHPSGIADDRDAIDALITEIKNSFTIEVCRQAIAAINRILTKPSEIDELWAESKDYDIWRRIVLDVRERIEIYIKYINSI